MFFHKSIVLIIPIAGIIFIGISLILHFGNFLNKEIIDKIQLKHDENNIFNSFLNKTIDPPYKMEMKVWIYSVINADQVINNGIRPKLIEIGPYVFNEIHHKTNVKFTSNDRHLLYRNNHLFFFNRNLSCETCELHVNFTIPNIMFQKFIDITIKKPFFKIILNELLTHKHETAYINVTAGNLLFDGYHDPLVHYICSFVINICNLYGLNDKIGIFNKLNNTDDGLYEIGTGVPDISTLGKIISYKEMTKVLNDSFWKGSEARMMNGTNSELFPPFQLLSAKKFYIFIGSICRSVEMEFAEKINVQGLNVYRFKFSKSIQNVPLQKHMGFCLDNTPKFFNNLSIQYANCLPATLLDLSQCIDGQPRIYYSNSHFLHAPVELIDSLDGLVKPNSKDDESTLDIDPLTGVIVQAIQRYQLNVGVLRGNLSIVKNMIPALIVPLIRAENFAIFDSETHDQLLKIYLINYWLNIIKISLFIIGLIFEVVYVWIIVSKKYILSKNSENDPLLNENEDIIQIQQNIPLDNNNDIS